MLRHIARKQKTNHTHTTAKTFAWLELFKSFALASFLTVFPIILYNKIGTEDYIGYYNAIIALVALAACILSSYIFCKYSRSLITKITLTAAILLFISMTLATNIWELMFLDIPRAVCLGIVTIALSLYVGDYSQEEDLAVNEARYYLFANIGWFTGPFVAGLTVRYFGFESMFILCSISLGIALLYFLHQHLISNHPYISQEDDVHDEELPKLFSNIFDYFHDKERFKVFLVAAGLNLSWTSAVYILIAVKMMGYNMAVVGLIGAMRALPLIMFEPWVGKMASKHGVRKYIIIGFFLAALMTFSFVFLEDYKIALLIMFCLVNIGMAFVEPLQETYFFEVVKGQRQRDKFFGIYDTAQPVMCLLAPVIASVILILTMGFNALWIFYGVCMLIFSAVALTIKEK